MLESGWKFDLTVHFPPIKRTAHKFKCCGLENLRVLEELSLEKNKLTGIQNLENLKYLKKLDLGSNKIKRISNVQMLASLT